MKKIVLLLILFGSVSFATILKVKSAVKKEVTTFYFIRHAEKESDGTKDPDLSSIGKQRANNYVKYFKRIKIDSIYSTNFKRTLNTVKPLTKSLNLEPIIYNPFKIDYKTFVEEHKNQTILIVGIIDKMVDKKFYNTRFCK